MKRHTYLTMLLVLVATATPLSFLNAMESASAEKAQSQEDAQDTASVRTSISEQEDTYGDTSKEESELAHPHTPQNKRSAELNKEFSPAAMRYSTDHTLGMKPFVADKLVQAGIDETLKDKLSETLVGEPLENAAFHDLLINTLVEQGLSQDNAIQFMGTLENGANRISLIAPLLYRKNAQLQQQLAHFQQQKTTAEKAVQTEETSSFKKPGMRKYLTPQNVAIAALTVAVADLLREESLIRKTAHHVWRGARKKANSFNALMKQWLGY